MKFIAEFEVESTPTDEVVPGESKFARLRRIARGSCVPIKNVTVKYAPCGAAIPAGALTMREAADALLTMM